MKKTLLNNKFEVLRNNLNLSNRDFAEKLAVHETQYTKMKKGNYPIGDKTINKIKKAFPHHNIDWILYGLGDERILSKKDEVLLNQVVDKIFKEDHRPVMTNYIPDYKSNMYLVPIKACGGFLAGYEKQEFDLEKIPFPLVKGECFAFEIDGYSMLSEYKPNDYFVGSKIEGFDWLVKGRDFVFQTVNGLILKRFEKIEDNMCFMKSLNEEYNPVDPIPLKEIKAIYQKEGVCIK